MPPKKKKPVAKKKAAAPKKKKAAPKKKAAAKRKKAPGSIHDLRTLGDVEPRAKKTAKRTKAEENVAAQALAQLRKEFEHVLGMKQKLQAENAIGGEEKGRQMTRQTEKLRQLISSLEGMNRFAMALGLITPAEARELYANAMKQGLYDGWR